MKRSSKLFLVVEDFEDSRFMMRRLLVVILMDLSLPKLDGLAATRQIRQKKGLKRIPIVAVSAHDSPESRIEALEAGCDEYVTKPIDFDRLHALLERFVSQAKSSHVAH